MQFFQLQNNAENAGLQKVFIKWSETSWYPIFLFPF